MRTASDKLRARRAHAQIKARQYGGGYGGAYGGAGVSDMFPFAESALVAIASTDQGGVFETHSACSCWLPRRLPVRSTCDVVAEGQHERHGRRKCRDGDKHVCHAV